MSSTPPGQQAGTGQDQVIIFILPVFCKFFCPRQDFPVSFEFNFKTCSSISFIPSRGSKETSQTVTLSFSSSSPMMISLQGFNILFWSLKTWKSFFIRMSGLDSEMEKEIDDLRRRYHAKRSPPWDIDNVLTCSFQTRQPILDAMDQKRKRQQNFWAWRRLPTYETLTKNRMGALVSFILALPIQLGPHSLMKHWILAPWDRASPLNLHTIETNGLQTD